MGRTIKEVDKDIGELKETVAALAAKTDGLATTELMTTVLDTVTAVSDKVEKLQQKSEPPNQEAPEIGIVEEEAGDYKDINEYDPALHVEIYLIPGQNVRPQVLDFIGDNGQQLRYAPKFAEVELDGATTRVAHYCLPRRFAEGQIKNNCSQRWGLSWPAKLTYRRRTHGMRNETVTVPACLNHPPIIVDSDGKLRK